MTWKCVCSVSWILSHAQFMFLLLFQALLEKNPSILQATDGKYVLLVWCINIIHHKNGKLGRICKDLLILYFLVFSWNVQMQPKVPIREENLTKYHWCPASFFSICVQSWLAPSAIVICFELDLRWSVLSGFISYLDCPRLHVHDVKCHCFYFYFVFFILQVHEFSLKKEAHAWILTWLSCSDVFPVSR